MSAGRGERGAAEIGFALFLLAVSAAMWWGSLGLPPASLEPIGPAVFPRVISLIMALLALTILANALISGRQATPRADISEEKTGGTRHWGLALATLLLSIAYLAAMQIGLLGFRESTVLYLMALGAALTGFDRRRLLVVAAIAVVVGIGTHAVFTRLFYIDLP